MNIGIVVALKVYMIRLLIAAYIVVVLVISAKAGAGLTEKSNLVVKNLNYSSEAP